jgi:hypothetical protein
LQLQICLSTEKMKILSIIAFLLPLCGLCQNTSSNKDFSEPTEWNLKGKVKSITNYIFDNVELKLAQAKFIDTAKCSRINSVKYDDKGNVISTQNIAKSKLGRETIRIISNVSNFPNKRVSTQMLNGDTFSIITKRWITDRSYTDTIKDGANKNISLTTSVLDKKGVIKTQRIESLKEYDITKPVILLFSFNAKNQLSQIVTMMDHKVQGIEINKDLTFDKVGNAIKSLKQQKDKRTLIIREYEYY